MVPHRLWFQKIVEATERLTYTWEQVKGAFLGLDLPELLTDDETVLYTDCNVMFLVDPSTFELKTNFCGRA